jgi:hypothetical protein
MPSPALPIVAGLSVLAAALGMGLGRAAIEEIDPSFFRAPESRFHADLAAYRSPSSAPAPLQLAEPGSPEGNVPANCPGCVAARPVFSPQPVYEERWSASGASVAAEPLPVAVAAADEAQPGVQEDEELRRVERYASYRVSEDEGELEQEQEPVETTGADTQ